MPLALVQHVSKTRARSDPRELAVDVLLERATLALGSLLESDMDVVWEVSDKQMRPTTGLVLEERGSRGEPIPGTGWALVQPV